MNAVQQGLLFEATEMYFHKGLALLKLRLKEISAKYIEWKNNILQLELQTFHSDPSLGWKKFFRWRAFVWALLSLGFVCLRFVYLAFII